MKAHNVHVMHDKQVIHKESDNHFYVKGKKSDSIANPRYLGRLPQSPRITHSTKSVMHAIIMVNPCLSK